MNKFIGVIMLFFALSGSVFAQNGSRKDQIVKKMTDSMQVHLSMNEEQYKKVYSINTEFVNKLAAIKKSGDGKMAKYQQFKAADKERDAALKPVLTNDQFRDYQEFKKDLREEMKENYRNSKS